MKPYSKRFKPANIARTTYKELSHGSKSSFNIGQLVPIYMEEVVPGDYFKIDTSILLRLAPLVAPIYSRLRMYVHFFYIPWRIVWSDWKKFITYDFTSLDPLLIPSCNSVLPNIELPNQENQFKKGSLADHLGLPTHATGSGSPWANETINMLPFRAYFSIWNNHYRHPLIDVEYDLENEDNQEIFLNSGLLTRHWDEDYFTGALDRTTLKSDMGKINADISVRPKVIVSSTEGLSTGEILYTFQDGAIMSVAPAGASVGIKFDTLEAVTFSIEELREANSITKWLELATKAGEKYQDHLLAFFGVEIEDQSISIPKYIGGFSEPVQVSEVIQTTPVDGMGELGAMGGRAIGVGNGEQVSTFCSEHGIIMGIMSVIPETAYYQGKPRLFSKRNPFDFYFPQFAELGEQEILNKEIYVGDLSQTEPHETFGYVPRYQEYRTRYDTVHGEFRDTLDFWHTGRKFTEIPSLNPEFLKAVAIDDDEYNPWRIFAVTRKEQVYANFYFDVEADRPIPYPETAL